MARPKITFFYRMTLDMLGLEASCYQPVHLFHKNGRKLPNVAEPDDPWQVFLRKRGEFGIVGRGVGATLSDAISIALQNREGRGLTAAMRTLGEQVDLLSEALRACQD